MNEQSKVDVMYMYEKVRDILECKDLDSMAYVASRLSDELAHNYKVDTGRLIGHDMKENK